jgi:urea transporter
MASLSPSFSAGVPVPILVLLRGIGQVFFQENALTGTCFVLGIAVSSPLMAAGAVAGSAIGTAAAWVLKLDPSEVRAGIYGFNATLVGIATLFFFRPGATSIGLLCVGCVAATLVTWLARRYLPFPTYTAPFVVTTWAVVFLGLALDAARVEPGGPVEGFDPLKAVAHGVGQVMFQASLWTGLLFLIGIALNDWRHASWVLVGSILGMLLGYHQATAAARSLDPERLADRALLENVALGLYGYNATLAAVALFLWRRSWIPPILGIMLSVPLTDLVPRLGLPALTAPFVLAAWIVLALGWLEERIFREPVDPLPSP